ncbi:Proclotting enzyme, partial [Armadillidium vulgare]
LNETAEKLAAEGFNIQVNEVGFGDVLCNFTFSNGTYKNTLEFEYIGSVLPTGGEPANAQIGEQKEGKIKWVCDGVLINNRWILSAAHCFTEPDVNPNVVRLGDLDKSDFKDPPLDRKLEFIRDYPIHQLVPYPDFNSTIFPICLPWDTETNRDLVGLNVTLTGWGATEYRGPKTSRLQEVNLTVYETSVCHEAYSDIPVNRRRYPQGITEDRLLCVGWKEDGKDACGGDSGAPIVYLKDDSDKSNLKEISITSGKMCGPDKTGTGFGLDAQKRRFVLAGIVSGGFGCGLKEFPGLYTPINKPNYMRWIKEVAFKDYV